jgi:hypothetical protein
VVVYQLVLFMAKQKFPEAIAYMDTLEPGWLTAYHMVDEEKQWELYFYNSLSYFGMHNWKKSHQFINEVMRKHQAYSQWLVCKATRLLNIIIYYEKGDTDYIEYEIRSYKRFFGRQQLLKSELLLFRFIKIWPDPKRKKMPELQLKKMIQEFSVLQKDRYERQLLKYFDFTEWMKGKLKLNS